MSACSPCPAYCRLPSPARPGAGLALALLLLLTLLASVACGPDPEALGDAGPGFEADAAAADSGFRDDASSDGGSRDDASGVDVRGGDAGAQDSAAAVEDASPASCAGEPPRCHPTPYGGCCMLETVAARCADEQWSCPGNAAPAEECEDSRNYCPMDWVDGGGVH